MRSEFQPRPAGLSEKANPGKDGATTWKASSARPPWAFGFVKGSMTLRNSSTDPGQPCVMRIGSAFSCSRCSFNEAPMARLRLLLLLGAIWAIFASWPTMRTVDQPSVARPDFTLPARGQDWDYIGSYKLKHNGGGNRSPGLGNADHGGGSQRRKRRAAVDGTHGSARSAGWQSTTVRV